MGFGRVHYISGSVVVRRRAMRRIDSMSADSFSSQLHARTHSAVQRCAVQRTDAPDGLCVTQWAHRKRTVMERVVVSHSTLVWPVSFFTSLELHRRVLEY